MIKNIIKKTKKYTLIIFTCFLSINFISTSINSLNIQESYNNQETQLEEINVIKKSKSIKNKKILFKNKRKINTDYKKYIKENKINKKNKNIKYAFLVGIIKITI